MPVDGASRDRTAADAGITARACFEIDQSITQLVPFRSVSFNRRAAPGNRSFYLPRGIAGTRRYPSNVSASRLARDYGLLPARYTATKQVLGTEHSPFRCSTKFETH